MPCSWEQQSCPWATRASILKTITPKADLVLLRIIRWNNFLSASRIWMELFKRTRRLAFVCMVQGRLVAAGYCSRHPDRHPRLMHDHRRRRRMLTHKHQNWNHQHWPHVLFLMSLSQPLQQYCACPSFSSCCWKISGLLLPRNRSNSRKRRPEW